MNIDEEIKRLEAEIAARTSRLRELSAARVLWKQAKPYLISAGVFAAFLLLNVVAP